MEPLTPKQFFIAPVWSAFNTSRGGIGVILLPTQLHAP